MVLVKINMGRGLTLPALIRKKYSLKPGAKLELKDKNGKIELIPLVEKNDEIFSIIDKHTKMITDDEIANIKKKVRTHSILH